MPALTTELAYIALIFGLMEVYAALTTLLPSITLAKPFDLDATRVAAPQEEPRRV